jgi:hypothetical protein
VNERETIDRGWYYVIEPDEGANAPSDRQIRAEDGRVLSRRVHGFYGRVDVTDASGANLPVATLLRAASAVGAALEPRKVGHPQVAITLGPAGTENAWTADRLVLDGQALAALPIHHPAEALVASLLPTALPKPTTPDPAGLPARPATRMMFFESLMNTDMPHNDREISQGVLHMISGLPALGVEVVLVNAKMPITGELRPVLGLDNLVGALQSGPVSVVCITLLEGYWEGVVRLIRTLRQLGCRARIAVGGVMPSLAPEHVAAHLPDVSFVCRGAGEHFVPKLATIVGDTDVDTPLTEAQVHALLQVDGMIAIDRVGGTTRVLSGNSARNVAVENLDRVELDLRFVEARHIEGGIEVSTSRGCIHKCSFCSILGRESYSARSSGSIFEVLAAYERRFHELHGERIPPNAFRVHFSDDDFACDRERAKTFFENLLTTKFRLSSVQVAIGDLCRKENGRVLAEPDTGLLDAMKAECFADHNRGIPKIDYYEDHRSRDWSSFLQIGVETYSDPEIARLGKGYKRVHVRTIVAELARRDLHMDGYFILSNSETTAADLVEVFSEVARLKLRFPEHFHLRFPVVPHLVSYFTSASHRRHVRQGRAHVMKLRGLATVPGHPEYDYPFVDHDTPHDGWVDRTVQTGFVTDERFYTANLDVLTELWTRWHHKVAPDHPDHGRIAHLLRLLDDRPRRLVFEMLRQAWLGEDEGWPDQRLDREASLSHAEVVLGPHAAWLKVFKHHVKAPRVRRLVAWTTGDLSGATALLAASDEPALELHLRGATPVEGLPDQLDATAKALDGRALTVYADVDLVSAPELSAVVARQVELIATVEAGSAWAHGAITRLALEHGATVHGVVRVSPDAAEHAGVAVAALRDLGVGTLRFEPHGAWTGATAKVLATSLFGAVASLRGAVLLDNEAQGPRSGQDAELLLDAAGHIGRADGLGDQGALRAEARFASLSGLTNLDRHFLDLADPEQLRGMPTLDALARQTSPADKVIKSLIAWLAPKPAADGQAGKDASA